MSIDGGVGEEVFGGVLINASGQVLLRQPAGQFGGYAWTFAKGKAKAGEPPSDTALRHVLADTGWHGEILAGIPGTFAGTTTTAKFFLVGRIGLRGEHDAETSAIRWVEFEEAAELIRQSPNALGRDRDLAILWAAEEAKGSLGWVDRPAACKEDGEGSIRQLPDQRTEIALDLLYDDGAMARIRKGFLPVDMDEKWFMWFHDGVLHLHRSWTGFCIFEVRFEPVEGGWRAVSTLANRDPDQYGQTRDEEDRRYLAEMIDVHLLNDEYENTIRFGGVPALATQPNYLGSPSVVRRLIQTVIDDALAHHQGRSNFNGLWATIWEISQQIAEGDEYVLMPGWHTPQAIGEALLKYFNIMREPSFANDLGYPISEALMTISAKVREFLQGCHDDEHVESEAQLSPQLEVLREWAVNVFLGTNELFHPGVTIDSFHWDPTGFAASEV